jgi:SAM-dependent methyltransferase
MTDAEGTRPTPSAGHHGSSSEERWALFERFGLLLHQQEWIFAKTMAHNPHWYTLRRKWESDEEFQWAVAYLRAHGYRSKFGKTWYTQIDVNDHFYWTMGAPINYPNGMARTILINRKPLSALDGRVVPFDSIADQYDDAFAKEVSLRERATVFEVVGDLAGVDVLDVGCGTGAALNFAAGCRTYTGIDPSKAMLNRLLAQRPNVHTVCTTLRSFVPKTPNGEIDRYDAILALFGTGSYLSNEELERIPMLLRPGGRAIVMFYAGEDATPQYFDPGVTVPHRIWAPGMFQGEIQRMGHHILCIWRHRVS